MYQIDFNHPVHVYFCGIGGISMSGLAEILKSRGFTVSGSDRSASAETERLESHGIRVSIGQRAENITDDIRLAVFTAAIHPDNPEYIAVQEKQIPSLTRAELLGEIMRNYGVPIAVSGTHGKTTTTSMISEILLAADTDPTLSIGGNLSSIGGNVRIGHSSLFVAEACEYTNSFLSMYPQIGLILNIDADHLDFFKDLEDIRRSFRKFAELIPENGVLILRGDIPDPESFTSGLHCRIITFGASPSCDYYPGDIHYDAFGLPSFSLCHKQGNNGSNDLPGSPEFTLRVPGEHNIYNAIAAIAAADVLGIDRIHTKEALASYHGTDRRFQHYGQINGITVVDDYAHHPTEIAATLAAARNCPHKRLFVLFQPHTYTRTKSLLPEFAKALSAADVVVLADIYAARETDTLGISSRTLQSAVSAEGTECIYFEKFSDIEKYVLENCQSGDLVITMGAGNINEIAKNLVS